MKSRHGVLVLLFSTACMDQASAPTESTTHALGIVPPTESAIWKRGGTNNLPDGRYAQALAFDETRQVVVMFGGMASSSDGSMNAQQDTWEFSPAQGAWTARTVAGTAPAARTGAAMAYDSTRNKFVMFGGRAGSGYDYQDTWEWDPTTGVWTDKTSSGAKPSARSQHGMIFDSQAGKIVLFGGGRSLMGGDIMTVSLAFADTWEYDGATATWTQLTTASAPSARTDFGFAYSSQTSKAYLFGGMEVTSADAGGSPMQDTWEWDSTAGTWTERTSAGSKPSPRFGHGMAINSAAGQAVIFGGYDMITGGSLNDVWYWDIVAGTWTGKQAASGATWPSQRQWSSLVASTSASRLYLVAGLVGDQGSYNGMGGSYGYGGYAGSTGGYGVPICPPGYAYCTSGSSNATREVWELDPATTTWVDRSAPNPSPGPRYSHAMAADPVSGKVYVYAGEDAMGNALDDLWEWDGVKWVECTADSKPPARIDSAMAYDPARKSLIIFGGTAGTYSYYGTVNVLADTWEWNTGTRKWTQLFPAVSPSQRSGHGMVTDSARNKIILYAGYDSSVPEGMYPVYTDPNKTDLWEWDGASSTWTDRTPALSATMPTGGSYPSMVFDNGRKKVELFETTSGYYGYSPGYGSSAGDYWEWDPVGGAWSQKVTGEMLGGGLYDAIVSYDSIRRRSVVLGTSMMMASTMSTWELDSSGPTWYSRPPSGEPSDRSYAAMAFDNQRGVVVMYGGMLYGVPTDETWQYSVTGWGNGTGCTAATASQCASGNCVDSVCCDSASCSGPCKACNSPGNAGTCVLAAPGTQVAGSCSDDQACDATGACKAANGTACASAAACASGFCSDGVCCDGACTGTCLSCKLAASVGTCSPFPVGTDPENDCSMGIPPCQSACDGIGACFFPVGVSCGACGTCNGIGSCTGLQFCPPTNTATSTLTGISTSTGRTGIVTATRTGTVTTGFATATITSPTATVTGTGTRGTGTATSRQTGTFTSGATSTATGGTTQPGTAISTSSQTGTAGTPLKLGQGGCDCDLGSAPASAPGIHAVLGLLGAILVWRRTRKRR